MNVIGLILAILGGFGICLLNYFLSKQVLQKKPSFYPFFAIFRQLLDIGYLVLCYCMAPLLPFERTFLLIGAAIGVTLPMFYLTKKLVRISEESGQLIEEKTKQED